MLTVAAPVAWQADDWAAFRAVAVLIGQIIGAALQQELRKAALPSAAAADHVTDRERGWSHPGSATVTSAASLGAVPGGGPALENLAESLMRLGRHFASPFAGLSEAAEQAAAICADLGELFRPALEEFAAAVTSKPQESRSFPANLLNAWPFSSAGSSLMWAPDLGPRMLEEATTRFGAVFEQVLVRLERRLASEQYAAPKAALGSNPMRANNTASAARSWQKLHPSELRALLSAFGLSTAGDKEALVARLTERLVLQEASTSHCVDAARRLRSCASGLEQWQLQGRCLLEITTSTLREVEQSLLQNAQEPSGDCSIHTAAAPKRRRGSSQRARGASGPTGQSLRDEATTAAANDEDPRLGVLENKELNDCLARTKSAVNELETPLSVSLVSRTSQDVLELSDRLRMAAHTAAIRKNRHNRLLKLLERSNERELILDTSRFGYRAMCALRRVSRAFGPWVEQALRWEMPTITMVGGRVVPGDRRKSAHMLDLAHRPVPRWYDLPSLSVKRSSPAVVALRDGRVIVAGGYDGTAELESVEMFCPPTHRSVSSVQQHFCAKLTRKPRSDAELARLLAELGMPMPFRHLFEKAKLEAKTALGDKYKENRLWATEIREIDKDGLLVCQTPLSAPGPKKRQREGDAAALQSFEAKRRSGDVEPKQRATAADSHAHAGASAKQSGGIDSQTARQQLMRKVREYQAAVKNGTMWTGRWVSLPDMPKRRSGFQVSSQLCACWVVETFLYIFS